MAQRFGFESIGTADATAIAAMQPEIQGFFSRIPWRQLQPRVPTDPNSFDWSVLDLQVQACVDAGIFFGLILWVGPHAPDWVYGAPYNVPQVHTDDTTPFTVFPYYFNPTYKQLVTDLHNAIRNHINSSAWTATMRASFKYWESAEGSTGDQGPYKGTPFPGPNGEDYTISDDDWELYKQSIWETFHQYYLAKKPITPVPLLNTTNQFESLDFVTTNYPEAWIKQGDATHFFNILNEQLYKVFTFPVSRGELENVVQLPGWNRRTTSAVFWSALTLEVEMINFSAANMSSTPPGFNAKPIAAYFNKYVSAGAERGYCVLRESIDYTNLIRFPALTYGSLINPDPTATADYNNAVAHIMATIPIGVYRQYQLNAAAAKYLNPARKTAIEAAMAPYGASPVMGDPPRQTIPNYDLNDFGYYLLPYGDYERGIYEINSRVGWLKFKPKWRTGTGDDMFGRFGKTFHDQGDPNYTPAFQFNLNKVAQTQGADFTIDINYFATTGTWILEYTKTTGEVSSLTVTPHTYNAWIQESFVLTGVDMTKPYHFAFKQVLASQPVFALVEYRDFTVVTGNDDDDDDDDNDNPPSLAGSCPPNPVEPKPEPLPSAIQNAYKNSAIVSTGTGSYRSFIAELVEDFRLLGYDTYVPTRYIYHKLVHYGRMAIRQDSQSARLYKQNHLFMTINEFPMCPMDFQTHAMGNLIPDREYMITKFPLPDMFTTYTGLAFTINTVLPSDKTFMETRPEEYKHIINRKFRDTRIIYYWQSAQNIIMPDVRYRGIMIYGLFVNPLDVKRLNGTFDAKKDKLLDQTFCCPEYLYSRVKMLVLDDMKTFKGIPKDEVPDMNSNNMQQNIPNNNIV